MHLSAAAAHIDDGDCLIIVPPFARLEYPSLAAHLLQAIGSRAGFRVRVFYANLAFASMIGEELYSKIALGAPYNELSGERVMRWAAFNLRSRDPAAPTEARVGTPGDRSLDLATIRRLEERATDWADGVADLVAAGGIPVVGATTTFEQTAASIALLRRIKAARPEVITIIGGGNCEGEMAEGLLSVKAPIDYVFQGESESSFPDFLRELAFGRRPRGIVIKGQPCRDLDGLPTPNYSDYFAQRRLFLPDSRVSEADTSLLAESSRGCWWGEKHQCTFCGFNGLTMRFREKRPERVLEEIQELVSRHPSRRLCMADNIMPFRYFRALLPRLAEDVPGLHIYYEQKANLSLEKVMLLRAAGVDDITAGIESLSTSLLRRMDKGVTCPQNIATLRYLRAAGIRAGWGIIHSFPGDSVQEYRDMIDLMPLLRHLQPPQGLYRLTLDRYSLYFDRPKDFAVSRVRPLAAYAEVFPPGTDLSRLAYHFDGDYASGSRDNPWIIDALDDAVRDWREAWSRPGREFPALYVERLRDDRYILLDRRGLLQTKEVTLLDRDRAHAVLAGRATAAASAWAVQNRLALEVDGAYVPLAVATPELLRSFEAEGRKQQNLQETAGRLP